MCIYKIINDFMYIIKIYFFLLCIYKMALKITKETWGKCGFKTIKYYNEKEDTIECGIK